MFKRPHPSRAHQPTRHLFVGNCGTKLGFSEEDIRSIFRSYSLTDDLAVHVPHEECSHCYVSFKTAEEAAAAVQALSGKPCEAAKGRLLMLKYAELDQPKQEQQHPAVALTAEQAGIPGLQLHPEFITVQQEAALLQQIDQQPWVHLSKRRVQHYGYKFEYSQRSIDPKQQLGPLPTWVQAVVQQMQSLPDVLPLDQLTVNEYSPGVGLSAHIDTHSAFSGAILSLSLAGGCVMEFRKTSSSSSSSSSSGGSSDALKQQCNSTTAAAAAGSVSACEQQVLVYLPPRALLVMGGECRYAWQHYIPHRKADWVNDQLLPRAARRVSLTFRKVRGYPCDCSYPEYCDSQLAVLPPTRIAQLQQQQQQQQQQECAASAAQSAGDSFPICHQSSTSHSTRDDAAVMVHQDAAVIQQDAAVIQQTNKHNGADPATTSSSSSSNTAAPAAAADADAAAAAMERVHVHAVYDAIALHFSATRFAVWPKVRQFLESLPPNAVVADVGCGNGKYFGVRRDLAVLGSDRSEGLAGVAMRRLLGGDTSAATGQAPIASPGADVLLADGLQLPYRPGSCDAVLCIAVLHHMGSRMRRLKLLNELAAVLVPGGRGIVTVWATEQENPAKTINKWTKLQATPEQQQQQGELEASITGPDYMVPWHVPFHRAGGLLQQQQLDAAGAAQPGGGNSSSSRAGAGHGAVSSSVNVDARKGAVVLQRYYHLFEEGELEGLVGSVPGLSVADAFYDRSNWCVVFEKKL